MAGYSSKSLLQKLGYQSEDSLLTFEAPNWFLKYIKDEGIELVDVHPTWLHGFFSSRKALEDFLAGVDLNQVAKGLWVSWPKKSSGLQTDLSEQTFRDLILPLGWVDVKVVAIDDTWSGLLFYRRKN